LENHIEEKKEEKGSQKTDCVQVRKRNKKMNLRHLLIMDREKGGRLFDDTL